MKKRILAMMMAAALCVSSMPFSVLADEVKTSAVSNPKTEEITNDYGQADLKTTWDCVYFGRYPQSDSTGETTESIKWRVLSVNGNDAFLFADQNLDCQPYHTEYMNVTWENCYLREWLNNTFYNKAFDTTEKNGIYLTHVLNDDNPYYGTEGGNDTYDKIYLLSLNEATNANYGFPKYNINSKTRCGKNSNYATTQGAVTYDQAANKQTGCSWMRTPGHSAMFMATVLDFDGNVNETGRSVELSGRCVRPVLHLDLSSACWTYAGTVCSEDDGSATATPEPTVLPTPEPSLDVTPKPVVPTTTVRPIIGSSTISKAANTLTVKAKKPTIKYSKLKKKKQTIKAKKAFTISGAQGNVTYKLVSVKKAKFKKYFKVSKAGKIAVKKGLKKGTYKLKVNVTAAGNANYEPLTKTVTVKIKVK